MSEESKREGKKKNIISEKGRSKKDGGSKPTRGVDSRTSLFYTSSISQTGKMPNGYLTDGNDCIKVVKWMRESKRQATEEAAKKVRKRPKGEREIGLQKRTS